VSPQSANGTTYTFVSWSDGGSASHTINTPSAITTFTANFAMAPTLAAIANQTMPSSQQTLNLPLSATGSPPPTFTATGQSLAYVLTRQTGTLTYGSQWDNFGGRSEKWLQAAGGQWYFILPTGELDRRDASAGANGTALGKVGASYYADPTRLTNPPANQPHATFAFAGSTLTITRDLAWTSSMIVTVSVSNGQGSDTKSFNVLVTP
jgi:hypothetical protein